MKTFNPYATGTESLDWSRDPLLSARLRQLYDKDRGTAQNFKPKQAFHKADIESCGKVLIVDDDKFSLSAAAAPLIKLNYNVTVAESYKQSLNYITECTFDLIILDYVLADATGYDVLRKSEEIMGDIYANCSIPLVTYSTQEQQHIRIPELTIFNYLGHWKKPLKRKELHRLLKTLKPN